MVPFLLISNCAKSIEMESYTLRRHVHKYWRNNIYTDFTAETLTLKMIENIS